MDAQVGKKAESDCARLPTEDEMEMVATARDSFTKRFIFIAEAERSRAISTSAMIFLIIFVYSSLKAMKNAMVAGQIDPSAISYIKLLVVLPINIVTIAFTQKMVSARNVSRTFTFMVLGFSALFFIYGTICFICFIFDFSSMDYATEDLFSDGKMTYKGVGVVFYVMLRTFTSIRIVLYYLLSELYGSIITSYLFWSFTNEFLTRRQALRFTPLFLMTGNLGLLFSGFLLGRLNSFLKNASYELNQYFAIGFPLFCSLVCTIICVQKQYFERHILSKEIVRTSHDNKTSANTRKRSVSFLEAFKIIFASRLVLGISVAVFAYNFSLNIIEGFCIRTYKVRAENSSKHMKAEHHIKDLESLGQIIIAIVVILFSFLPSGKFIEKGYFLYYAVSSCIIAILGTVFVISIGHFNIATIRSHSQSGGIFGTFESRLYCEEKIAFAIMLLFRIIKYAAFDLTKEALSMRINPMYRAIFKGVYDGHFGKLSKACGALYSIGANYYYDDPDIRSSSIPSFLILMSLNFFWVFMIFYLSKRFNKSMHENTDIELDWVQGKPMF